MLKMLVRKYENRNWNYGSSVKYIECDGIYITKTLEIENYFNDFVASKIMHLPLSSSCQLIKKKGYDDEKM